MQRSAALQWKQVFKSLKTHVRLQLAFAFYCPFIKSLDTSIIIMGHATQWTKSTRTWKHYSPPKTKELLLWRSPPLDVGWSALITVSVRVHQRRWMESSSGLIIKTSGSWGPLSPWHSHVFAIAPSSDKTSLCSKLFFPLQHFKSLLDWMETRLM